MDKQRHNAEKEAAKHRSKTRELNETILIQTAHTEAYKLGMEEGLNRGRELANADAAFIGGDQEEEYSDEENQAEHAYPPLPPDPPRMSSDHSRAQHNDHSRAPRSEHSMAPRSEHSMAPRSEHSRAPRSEHSRAPTDTRASPAPIQVSLPNSRIDLSENIRPISIHNISSSPRPPIVPIPPDNLIPTLDADMRIRIPPPYEFRHTPSPQLPAMSDSSQEPLPILPRANNPQQRRTHHRRNSSSGSNSSTLSQLDIINSTHGPGLRTPMSIIPEVSSAHSGSPLPRSEDGHRDSRHQRSVVGKFDLYGRCIPLTYILRGRANILLNDRKHHLSKHHLSARGHRLRIGLPHGQAMLVHGSDTKNDPRSLTGIHAFLLRALPRRSVFNLR